jgi:hypothetical protein
MNIRRMTITMMAVAVAAGGVLSVATSGTATAATANAPTFGALVPSTFVNMYSPPGTIPLTGVVSATAQCPAGMAAVSSGGLADGLFSITPGPGYDSGVVIARAVNGNTGSPIFAGVTCAPAAQFAGTTVATHETRAHSTTGEWTATVTCPAGMRAFGGGGHFRASNGAFSTDEFFLSADAPTSNGRGWTVSALDNTLTDTLVVSTRCAVQSSSTRLVEEIYPVVPAPGAGTVGKAKGYARCPAGFLPISGGSWFTQDASPDGAQPQLSVSIMAKGRTGWYAEGIDGSDNAQLHVIVLCGS